MKLNHNVITNESKEFHFAGVVAKKARPVLWNFYLGFNIHAYAMPTTILSPCLDGEVLACTPRRHQAGMLFSMLTARARRTHLVSEKYLLHEEEIYK